MGFILVAGDASQRDDGQKEGCAVEGHHVEEKWVEKRTSVLRNRGAAVDVKGSIRRAHGKGYSHSAGVWWSEGQGHPDVGPVVDAVVGEGDDLESEFAVEVDGAGQGGV